MPTVELDIRQLADEGGTAPLAPITVTDAVLDEDGNTLTDTLDELKSDLIPLNKAVRIFDSNVIYPTLNVDSNNWQVFLVLGNIATIGQVAAIVTINTKELININYLTSESKTIRVFAYDNPSRVVIDSDTSYGATWERLTIIGLI